METNVFLIDWLTFTVKGSTVDQVKALIGLVDQSVHWDVLGGCNGYPVTSRSFFMELPAMMCFVMGIWSLIGSLLKGDY